MSRVLYAETLESPFELPTVDPDEYDTDEDPEEDPDEEPDEEPEELPEVVDRDFRSWHVTREQADRIAAGDREAINRFMMDNATFLLRIAFRYAKLKNRMLEAGGNPPRYFPNEMISQLYVDLPQMDWETPKGLYYSIRLRSFAWCPFGGYAQRKAAGLAVRRGPREYGYLDFVESMETPISGTDGLTVGDLIEGDPKDRPDIAAALAEVKHLTAEEITAALSGLLPPSQIRLLPLFLNGATLGEIRERLGLRDRSAGVPRLVEKLRLNYVEVVNRLLSAGMEIPEAYVGAVPEGYEEALRKKEKNNRIKREWDRKRYAREREKKLEARAKRLAEQAGQSVTAG